MNLQVLRTLDKVDKLGVNGVVELLQKGPEEFGAGLDPVSAGLLGLFLGTKGESNEETLANLRRFCSHASRIRRRIDLMVYLEETVLPDGKTFWDRLINMKTNDDESWSDGGRPANIGWALDDMLEVLLRKKPSGTEDVG